MIPRNARPSVAGIYAALGDHERARLVRTAGRMALGQRYMSTSWSLGRRRERTGRDWRTQQRDGSGRWVEGRTS